MYCMYVQYRKIPPGDFMQNLYKMQETYNVKDPTKNMFGQIETGKEFIIAGNSPVSDRQLTDMGVEKILATR